MGEHRADIVTRRGVVVELQSAPLSPEQVRDREQFYGNMAWIVNAEPLLERLLLLKRFDSGRGFSFQWKHHPPSWRHATRPVFLDLGVGVSLDALLGCRRTVATMPDDYYARRVSRRAPDRADELEPALRQPGAFLLRIHSLHANGFGSVLLAARASLVKEIAGL